ncbi:hypothetical protein [Luteibacter yeojuensis]|uniref:Uncharacterized protein n=1 Tax=Luteibacter yeojuensis TaxID=345309 RepID=A0A0F3L265_9GAMM|nr:hypothetical protein [Luteibacter yeojuensis]KJV37322.1 hypothetical protein VI08_00465 [Luteibacter yeojuensis]
MRFVFPPVRRSRNPLVRALSLVAGLALLGVLLVFGVVVLGVLVAGGLVFFAVRQWKLAAARANGAVGPQPQAARPKDPDVLEGEFVVIQQGRPVHHH